MRLIELALDEDLGRGDVTSDSVLAGDSAPVTGSIVAREDLVVFGLDIAVAVFERVDPAIVTTPLVSDGAFVGAGTAVLAVGGDAISVLKAERTALNFMQRLSGIASLSKRFAEAVDGTDARVVDTRKTTPGYRVLQKAAVLAGGCSNHRFDLGSGVLIKDNHIVACGSVAAAVIRARERAPHSLRIEVEVERLDQLEQALDAGTDVVLLDNMSVPQVVEAVELAHEREVLVEVSGGVTLDTVAKYAHAGADYISVGALTHSAMAVDLALDFDER
jgi:nicotinate-nucleotide pyrophosphorylase (carboxylating)